MKVPFQDLTRLHASVQDELEEAMQEVIGNSSFVGGKPVAAFEAAFAAAHDRAFAAGCSSGTDALALALRAAGIGPDDEVIVPSMTFVATAEAVVHVGARPVLADVDAETLLLTAESVAAVRTPSTRAVIPVHLYGNPVPASTVRTWRDDGLCVIEDAAQAHLADSFGQKVGGAGHAACFSFYPGKNLGAFGDGGAVITNDEALIERVRALRDHGRKTKYVHDTVGWCSRLDGLQASILSVKLNHLQRWTETRRRLAADYARRLKDSAVPVVPFADGAVHHLFVVRVPADRRDDIQRALAAAGVSTGVHYPVPLSRQPALEAYRNATPHAERAAAEVLSLPMDPLMSHDEVAYVCEQLTAAVDAQEM